MAYAKLTDEQARSTARNRKIDLLLPVFVSRIAQIEGRTLYPLTDPADADLLLSCATDSLDGEHETVHGKDTLKAWNTLAKLTGIPEARWPSVETIERLVRRLGHRAREARLSDAEIFSRSGAA